MIDLHPRRSRFLVKALLLLHALAALLIVFLSSRFPPIIFFLIVPLASFGWHKLARHGYLRRPGSCDVVQIIRTQDDRWQLRERSQRVHEATLVGGTLVMPWVMLLCFSVPKQRTNLRLVLLPDSERPEKLRSARRELLCNLNGVSK